MNNKKGQSIIKKIKNYDWFFFFLFFSLLSIPYWFTTKDDTFIFLQVAKNIVQYGKFAFYPGRITNPITSHLWLFFVVLTGKILQNISPYLITKILNLICVFGIFFTYSRLVKKLISDYKLQFFCLLLLSLDPQLLRWSFIGMETPLAVLLVLLFFVLLYDQSKGGKVNFWLSLVVLAGCATRPEFFLIACLWIIGNIYYFLTSKGGNREKISRLFSMGLFFIGYAVYLAWQKIQFGYAWANPIRAKGLSPVSPPGWLFKYITTWGGGYGLQYILLICGLSYIFIISIRNRKIINKDGFFMYILLVWVFGVPFYYFFKGVFITDRYTVLTGPLVILTILYILQVSSKLSIFTHKFIITGVILFFLLHSFVLTYMIQLPTARTYTIKNAAIQKMGVWLKDNTLPTEKVFFPDVGVLGYYSDRDIIDFLLVYPQFIIGKRNQAKALREMGCQYYVFRADSRQGMKDLQSEYIVDNDRSFETLLEYRIESKGMVLHLREKEHIFLILAKANYKSGEDNTL